jgi:hypothetical protein
LLLHLPTILQTNRAPDDFSPGAHQGVSRPVSRVL